MKNYIVPDINSLMQIMKEDIMASIKNLMIGQVIDFDPKTRTITAKIVMQPIGWDINLEVSNTQIEGLEYPVLYQVPVLDCEYFSPPIHEDDYCLLIFCDRNIDGWLVEDETGNSPRDARKHNINDAFAWFGIGNFYVSSFIKPDDYEPPAGLPEINDCPIPKYGYQPDYARFRYQNGEIDLGLEPTRNGGVTICARDYSNINMFAEGSAGNDMAGNIMMFPTNSFHFNNGFMNIVWHGDSDFVLDPDNKTSGVDNPPQDKDGKGKLTIFNTKTKKIITPEKPDVPEPNNWWIGKTVPTSDMYRIMAQCKATLSEASKAIQDLGGDTTDLEEAIDEFKLRYKNLFAPADPIEKEE